MAKPIVINPCEGLRATANWQWHIKNNNGQGGEDWSTGKKHTIVSPVIGVVTSVGGIYGEIVIKVDDDPENDSIRIAENAIILVKKGDPVDHFTPIARDALVRGGIARDTHFNGIRNGARIPFTGMITHTQAAARIALTVDPVEPTERAILPGANANVRTKPSRSGELVTQIQAGKQIRVLSYVYGDIVNDNPLWYVLSVDAEGYPSTFLWSGGTTDTSPHDIIQAAEKPETPPVVPDDIIVTVNDLTKSVGKLTITIE
jgi:hypothetical protein